MSSEFKIMRTEDAKDLPLPGYMTEMAAGMDLYANITDDISIEPSGIRIIPSGICISIPDGYEAQIRPRSGLAAKFGVTLLNSPGTVDADYRGEIKLIMINHGKETFKVSRGDRIGQMVIARYSKVDWVIADSLDKTTRDSGGFGHTGA